ncbi:MAG: hypothetical protein ACOYVD_15665 [Bacillota bacterium]
MKKFDKLESAKWGLNITDQEISDTLAIDLEEVKKAKEKGEDGVYMPEICTGWWSNNWCE